MKKLIFVVVLISSLFLLVGCDKNSKKNEVIRPHSEEEIKELAKEKKLNVTAADNEENNSYSAVVDDGSGNFVFYYIFKSEESAQSYYKYYVDVLKAKKADSDVEKENEGCSYELTTASEYKYLMLDKKTVVLTSSQLDNKDETINILKSINYYN